MASSYSGFRGGYEELQEPSLFNDGRAARALLGAQTANQERNIEFTGAAMNAIGERQRALEYARAFEEQRKREKRDQQKRGLFGGVFNALGTAASFFPGVGPLIGAGLKGIGGSIG